MLKRDDVIAKHAIEDGGLSLDLGLCHAATSAKTYSLVELMVSVDWDAGRFEPWLHVVLFGFHLIQLGGATSISASAECVQAFGTDCAEATAFNADESGIGHDVRRTRAREIDGKIGENAAWRGAHQQDPVRQEDRLVGIMRNEQDGWPKLRP